MKYLILLLIISFSGTIQAQSEAHDLINRSIKHHDPKGNWSKFKADVHINSFVERKGKRTESQRDFSMDLDKGSFEMMMDVDGKKGKIYMNNEGCGGELPGSSMSEEELKKKGLSCDRAKMYNNYFQYLLGLPMKLKDPGTIVDPNVTKKEYKGQKYNVVKVTYDPEVGKDTWQFYFHPESNELVLCEFTKDGTFQNGETIELNNKVKHQKMILPGQLVWYVLPDRPLLAEENITYK